MNYKQMTNEALAKLLEEIDLIWIPARLLTEVAKRLRELKNNKSNNHNYDEFEDRDGELIDDGVRG